MDGVTVSVLGALVALAVAIVLILKKVQPTYAMIFGAVIGGLVGGAGLTGTVSFIISGTQGIVSAIIRIVTAGILAGALIESGAAERIAESIINKMGAKRSLIAITLATWLLTTVGVFGDVACITVAPIALHSKNGSPGGLSQDGRADGAAGRRPRGQRHEPQPQRYRGRRGL